MSATNAPFETVPSDDDKKEKKKHQYIAFDVPTDSAQIDGLKATAKSSYSTPPESETSSTIYIVSMTLSLTSPSLQALRGLMVCQIYSVHDHKKLRSDIVDFLNPVAKDRTQVNFVFCIDAFLKISTDEDASLDLKEFILQAIKPRKMSIQAFVELLRHLNNLEYLFHIYRCATSISILILIYHISLFYGIENQRNEKCLILQFIFECIFDSFIHSLS